MENKISVIDDYICEFEICEGSRDLLIKFLRDKFGNPEEDSEIGRTCYNFFKSKKLVVRVCVVQRVELEFKSTMRVYTVDVLVDLCRFFDMFINTK